MKRQELREIIRGLIVVTVTPFDNDFKLDLDSMSRDTEYWIENGVVKGKAVLKVASVMGELTSMTEAEWPQVVKTAVDTANGRVPVISCVHGKDTLRTIEDAKRAQDLGAVGLQIVPPFENIPNQDDIVRYYEAISDAIEIGVMIYHAHWMPHSRIEIETFKRMAGLEHIVAIKWNSPADVPYESMQELVDDFNIFDNSNQPGRCYKNGGQGFLDHLAPAYPQHELEILDLFDAGNFDEGQALWDKVSLPTIEFLNNEFADSGGVARLKKAAMAIMGHPVGSMRPPSQPVNDEQMDKLRDVLIGAGWPVPEAALA